MKMLKNCIKLSSSVKVYVPSTVNVSESVDTQKWVDQCLQLMADKFDGSTASKALGAWLSQGVLVKENVTIVFSYADQLALEVHMQAIYDFCIRMKHELGQEAIALEVNNELYLI